MWIENNKKTIVFLFCVVLFLQMFFASFYNSATSDEFPHLASGYSALVTGDLRMESEHPPLIKVISALPLLAFNLKFPCDDLSWKNGRHFTFYKKLLFVYNQQADKMLFFARIPMMLLSVVLLILVYLWASKLFGVKAGIFAAFLYAFEPNLLGFGGVVMTDLGLALFVFATSYAFWRFVVSPSFFRGVIFVLLFGLTQLTKHTAIFLVPLFMLLMLVNSFLKPEPLFHNFVGRHFRVLKRCPRVNTLIVHYFLLFVAGIFSLFIINVAYGFEGTFDTIYESYSSHSNLDKEGFKLDTLENINPLAKFVIRNIPNPLPYYYTKGIGYNILWDGNFKKDWVHTFLGETRYGRVFYSYYFLLLLFRLPIPLLIFILLAVYVQRRSLHKNDIKENEGLWHLLIPIIFFFVLFSITSRQNGLRYILGIFPFIIVFAAHSLKIFMHRKLLFGVLCLAYALSSLSVFPDYLGYFNEFLPSDFVYEVFQDTNVELGQHFQNVVDYLNSHQGIYGLLYLHRMDTLEFYKLNVTDVPAQCRPGKYIVDFLAFYYDKERAAWLSGVSPVDIISPRFFVYDVKKC